MGEHEFNPDWCTPPGGTVWDILVERRTSPQDFCEAVDLSISQFNQLLLGELPIDEALAARLAMFLGSSVNFWLTREQNYREGLAAGKKQS